MSLVNEVIEELKQREAGGGSTPEDVLSARDRSRFGTPIQGNPMRTRRHVVPWLFAAAGAAVLVFEFGSTWFPLIEPIHQTTAVSARPPISPLSVGPTRSVDDEFGGYRVVETNADPTSVEELRDLDVQLEDGYTRIFLHLTGEREYWLQGDPAHGEIEIVISGTRLATALAPQAFAGSGIVLREAHNSSTGLHLLFSFEPAARIQTQVAYGDRGPALVVDVIDGREREAEVSEPVLRIERRGAETASRDSSRPAVKEARDWGRISHTTSTVTPTTPDAVRHFERGEHFAVRGQRDEAIAEYVRALALDPDLHRAREALIVLLIESEMFTAATQHLEDAVARAPGRSEYNFLKARLLVATQQPERAAAILESLPVPPERRTDALNLLAALYQKRGDHARAETLFRHAVQLAPHEARLWMGLGISLEGQEREAEALAVYKQADSLATFETGPRRWLRSRIRTLSSLE